jgi:hypothetical protein
MQGKPLRMQALQGMLQEHKAIRDMRQKGRARALSALSKGEGERSKEVA